MLAGGLATRMRPRSETVPKSLLVVGGRPFVEWQLELLARSGLTDVVLLVAHLGEQIRAHVGDGARFGVRVTYVEEPAGRLLGTAGAIRAALAHLDSEFVVTYGDSYLPFDYGEPLRLLQGHTDCDGVMAIFHNANRYDRSNVVTDGTWVVRYDKTVDDPAFDHVDYGATALRRSVIAALPEGPLGLDAVQRELAARHRLRARVARERFYEVGSPAGLAELDAYLASQRAT